MSKQVYDKVEELLREARKSMEKVDALLRDLKLHQANLQDAPIWRDHPLLAYPNTPYPPIFNAIAANAPDIPSPPTSARAGGQSQAFVYVPRSAPVAMNLTARVLVDDLFFCCQAFIVVALIASGERGRRIWRTGPILIDPSGQFVVVKQQAQWEPSETRTCPTCGRLLQRIDREGLSSLWIDATPQAAITSLQEIQAPAPEVLV